MRDGNYETQMIQLNYDLGDHKKGSRIKIKTKDGIPVDPYWRRRFYDSKMDKCMEYCDKAKTKEAKEIEKEFNLNVKDKQKKRKET